MQRILHVAHLPALLFAALLATGCGGGESAICGADLTGVELCVEAATYIECGACVDDPDVDHTAYSIDLDNCENDGTLLCANCISFQSYRDGCILGDQCQSECASARN